MFIAIFINFLVLLSFIDAIPYPWQSNDVGYDASLDPIMWSRAFAKDTIRKPRYFKAFSLLRNLVGDERVEEELNQQLNSSGQSEYLNVDLNDDHTDERGFGKRRRKMSSAWYMDEVLPRGYRKYGSKKSISKRRHKLNARERYGLL